MSKIKKILYIIKYVLSALVNYLPYIFAAIALYQDNYLIALLLILFGIAMEIKDGFENSRKETEVELVHKIFSAIGEEMKKGGEDEKN